MVPPSSEMQVRFGAVAPFRISIWVENVHRDLSGAGAPCREILWVGMRPLGLRTRSSLRLEAIVLKEVKDGWRDKAERREHLRRCLRQAFPDDEPGSFPAWQSAIDKFASKKGD